MYTVSTTFINDCAYTISTVSGDRKKMTGFDKELRVRINDDLDQQLQVIMKKENDLSKASMIRRLIQDRYNELLENYPELNSKKEGIVSTS